MFISVSGQDTPKPSSQASPPRRIVAQCTETPSHLYGKSQPRLLQTYLFMKCEVMKKVLNPTTVLTLTVLSRDLGVLSCTPGGDRGLCHPHTPPQAGQRDGTGRGKPRRQHSPSTHPAWPLQPSSLQRPKLCQGFYVAAGKGVLGRVGKGGVTRIRKGKKNPIIAKGWFGELQGGATSLRKDSAQGSRRSHPLPDLPKVQQDRALPHSRNPLQKKKHLYI